MRVFLLIRSLERGGAERQLIELARGLISRGHHVTVCTFYDGGALRPDLERIAGIEAVSLGKKGRWDLLTLLWRLSRAVLAAKPDVIHAYMGAANELSLLMARATGAKSVWGLRSSNMDMSRYDWVAHRTYQVGALLSRFADAIIVNSELGRTYHIAHGYSAARMLTVHNGIDCERFKPDREARARIREEWRIGADDRVVGLIARMDPKKDHPTFLRAAAAASRRQKNLRFVCVGAGPKGYKEELVQLAAGLGLEHHTLWTGPRDDMSAVYNALDVMVLSSAFGEGFPNVVGEAMATGLRCVVTDVGDAAVVVGDTGAVVPPGDPAALANGILTVLRLTEGAERREREGGEPRSRILETFSPKRLVDATERILLAALSSEPLNSIPESSPPKD